MPSMSSSQAVETRQVAEYLSAITYETLPTEVILAAKHLLLDALGTTLAANTLGVGCREVVNLALGTKGSAESTLLGMGCKVVAPMAAFANGAMAHALNYDASGADGAHLGVASLAASFAVAELIGDVSGKEFLCAVVASSELTARLASVIAAAKRDDPTVLKGQLLGYFGATAGAGRILRLSPVQMHSALGIALMQAAGTMQVVLDGDPPAKAIYGAFPNQAGVISALLARDGVGAEFRVFEGPAGLFGIHYKDDQIDPGLLAFGSGSEFRMLGVRFKPWPTSGVLHPVIKAALKLCANDSFDAKKIHSLLIRSGGHVHPFCEPPEERRRPPNAAAAANSVYFVVAKTLLNKKLGLGDFTSDGLYQDGLYQLVDRMRISVEVGLGRSAIIEALMINGENYTADVTAGADSSNELTSYDELVRKFYDCAQYAVTPLSRDRLDRIVETISHLENLTDVSMLATLLQGEC